MYRRGDLVQHDIFGNLRGVVVEVVNDPELGTRFRVFWSDGRESTETERDIFCLEKIRIILSGIKLTWEVKKEDICVDKPL